MKIRSIVTFIISLSVALLLLYLAFKNIELESFIAKASEVEYVWIFVSILLAIYSHWLRSYRWNLMLEPLGYQLKTGRTLLAVMTGYLANLALPRIGEVTRCGVLKRNDGVPISISFGTVITERVVDLLMLIILIILNFITEFDKVFDFFFKTLRLEELLSNKTFIIVTIFGLLAVGLVAIFLVRKFLQEDSDVAWINNVKDKIGGLIDGLLSLRKINNILGFILSSIGIWLLYYLMSYVLIFSIAETSGLGLLAGLSILVAGALAMIVPVPGGTGAYHLTISGILVVYGIDGNVGLFFATLLHTSQFVAYLLFGGISVLITVFISKNYDSNSLNDESGIENIES